MQVMGGVSSKQDAQLHTQLYVDPRKGIHISFYDRL